MLSHDIENNTICMTSIGKLIREKLQHALNDRLINIISKTVENKFAVKLNKLAQLDTRLTEFEAKLKMVASSTRAIEK